MKIAVTAVLGASLLLVACGGTEPATVNEVDTLNTTDEVLLPEDNLATDPGLTDLNAVDANAADANLVEANTADANAADANLSNSQ